MRYWVAGAVCLAAVAALVFGALSRNVVYFLTPSEAVERGEAGPEGGRFRLAGNVVAGSVTETADGVRFDVTDGSTTLPVVHRGDPPQLFADGIPVVCEGRWSGDRFASERIMIRHGNEYEPPRVTTTTASVANTTAPVPGAVG